MSKLKNTIMILVFIIAIFLTFKGLKINSYKGLYMMLLGLVGILIDLYQYNKTFEAKRIP